MASKDFPGAQSFLPDNLSDQQDRDALAHAAAGCQGCPLYKDADHVVFGEGPTDARLMLVGEAPGRDEDEQGRPFVGRAGGVLDQALIDAGLDRDEVYITNGVKHIRWASTNGNRKPKAPGVAHIQACRPWLDAEVQLVKPHRIIALGSRAARSVLGEEVTISESRGGFLKALWGIDVVVSYHPSAALRHPVTDERERIYDAIVADLRRAQRPEDTSRPQVRP